MLTVSETSDGCTFYVRVVPRSRRDEVVGLHGDALKVRLVAPPEKGRANQALRKLLAHRLGVAVSSVEILSGHTSRQKRVLVCGVSTDAVQTLCSEADR